MDIGPSDVGWEFGTRRCWAMGKWGFTKMRVGEKVGGAAEYEVKEAREGVKQDGQWRDVQGPRAVPW